MDYKDQIEQAKHAAVKWREKHPIVGVGNLRVDCMVDDLTRSITDLLSRAEAAEAWAEKAERERDAAVKLCGKLMALCSPPKEWEAKLFRPCIKRPGDYMGSGYAFLDSFNRIFDEFTETADEETYRAIREAAEKEILDRTRRMIGQKEE